MLENVVLANAMERKAMLLGKLKESAFALVHHQRNVLGMYSNRQ